MNNHVTIEIKTSPSKFENTALVTRKDTVEYDGIQLQEELAKQQKEIELLEAKLVCKEEEIKRLLFLKTC